MKNTALRGIVEKIKSGAVIEIGIYLAAFSLPLYIFKINFWGLPLNLFEIIVYFLFLIWLSSAVRRFGEAKNLFREIKENRIFTAGLILFFSGALISVIFSEDLRVSAGILKGWFIAPFLLFLSIKAEIKTEKQIKNMFSALAASGAVVAAVSLFYFFSGRLTFDGRLAAFYLSPNHLAMFLAPIFILAAGLFFVSRTRSEKAVFAAAAALMLVSVYLTYSYGAWFAVFCASAFILFFSELSVKKKTVAFTLILAAIFVLLYFQVGGEKFQNFFSGRSSLASRLMIWKAALMILKDNPIFGIGPGMFQKYYLEYQKYFPPYLEWAVPQPHNLFLAFWLQTGIAGFSGFILILVSFFRKKIAFLRSEEMFEVPASKHYNFWIIAAMLVILIHSLIDTPYFKNDLSALFWIILAL